MIPITRCGRTRRRLGGFLDGELPPDEARRIEAHLDDCARCREALLSLRRNDALVREADVEEPGADYWDSFVPRLRERLTEERDARAFLEKRRPAFSPVWGGIIGGAAVATLAFLIYYANEPPFSPPSPIAPPRTAPEPSPMTTMNESGETSTPTETGTDEERATAAPPAKVSLKEIAAANKHATPEGGPHAESVPSAGRARKQGARAELEAGSRADATGIVEDTRQTALPEAAAPEAALPEAAPEAIADHSAPAEGKASDEADHGSLTYELSKAAALPTRESGPHPSGVSQSLVDGRMERKKSTRAAEQENESARDEESPPPDVIARDVMDRVAEIEEEARKADRPPDYTEVLPLLETLEPAARHPETSGIPDSLAAELIAALERARASSPADSTRK